VHPLCDRRRPASRKSGPLRLVSTEDQPGQCEEEGGRRAVPARRQCPRFTVQAKAGRSGAFWRLEHAVCSINSWVQSQQATGKRLKDTRINYDSRTNCFSALASARHVPTLFFHGSYFESNAPVESYKTAISTYLHSLNEAVGQVVGFRFKYAYS
jgi:hypothetical protein